MGTRKTVIREGIKFSYVDLGSGTPPLLFVHGWCCNLTHWRGQTTDFSRDHRCVSLDLRGHGNSDAPDQDYSIGGFVDDLEWFIPELDIDRPVLIGHSMGGCIGLNLAHRNPDLIRALVMVDSPLIPLGPQLQPLRQNVLAGFKGPTFKETAAGFVSTFMFNEDSDPALRDEVITGVSNAPQRLMHTAIESILSEANLPEGAIPVPSIFIRAATQTASAEEIAARYGGLPVAEVNAAHFLQMEKPAEVNRIIHQFLEGLT